VYIPQGPFWLGDGASEDAYQNSNVGNTPYQVTGSNNIIPGTGIGNLYDPETTITTSYTDYPNGYSAYWMMKYELSQGGYRDFLNTLTYTQQATRVAVAPNSVAGTNIYAVGNYRQYLEVATPGVNAIIPAVFGCDADGDNNYNESSDGEWVTVTGVNWTDLAAYLDWCGLRPMTEFEFEKACRGPLTPVPNEYAWGTDDIASIAYTLTGAGTASEAISNPSAVFGNSININSAINYARGGIFATAISTRVSSGAGCYGVMELSGNAEEQVVASSNVAGRSYTGKNGDGLLTALGNANENNWPGVNGATTNAVAPGIYNGGDGVTSDGGSRDRGGDHSSSTDNLRVSHRFGIGAGTTIITFKSPSKGIRGVRDAN
jgi:formylglycine-generating enzyme required for sulfatase activity